MLKVESASLCTIGNLAKQRLHLSNFLLASSERLTYGVPAIFLLMTSKPLYRLLFTILNFEEFFSTHINVAFSIF